MPKKQEPFEEHQSATPAGHEGAEEEAKDATRPAEALARVEHLLGADHVSALRLADEDASFEVVAAAHPGFVAPGVRLPREASDVASVALSGHIASIELEDSEAPLDALAYSTGLETAIALPVRAAPDAPVAGAIVIAWSGIIASAEAAEWAIGREREALVELLVTTRM